MAVPRSQGAQGGSPGAAGVRLARRSIERNPDIAACWPRPLALLESIEELRRLAIATQWDEAVLADLNQLHQIDSLAGAAVGTVLDHLEARSRQAARLAASIQDPSDRAHLMRVRYALERRLVVWRPVHELATPAITQVSLCDNHASRIAQRVQAIALHLKQLRNHETWRRYLLLDRLEAMAFHQWAACSDERSQLAREILTRIEAAELTNAQKRYFSQPAWLEFIDEMRAWVSEPVDYLALLDDIEQLERTRSEDAVRRVTDHYQTMRWSRLQGVAELGDRLNRYYRNANVRVAISGKLISRLLPTPKTIDEDVDSMVLGGRVFGRSRVSTRLRLVLFPDRKRWRMGLEAHGNVDSQTQTKRGPAKFHNAGRVRYLARKILLIDRAGIRAENAEAAAISKADLTKLETDLDGVPLVNWIARSIARQQYDGQARAAELETEGMVASRAQDRLDEEVNRKIDEATEKFRSKILRPLRDLGLSPVTVDMRTTEQRLIARYRLAGPHQVGAFTPRPLAPADSMLSLQVHESMLNNTVQCLELNGRESDLPSLFREIAARFSQKTYQVPDDIPEDVTLTLATKDPVVVRLEDGHFRIVLRIAKLASDRRVWRHFEVRAAYLPSVNGLHVKLVRDGYIRLKGRRLSTLDQIALRTIFSKVLAGHPDVDILGNILIRDRRLHDLRVVQCVVRDGWIGLAVGTGDPVKAHIADNKRADRRR